MKKAIKCIASLIVCVMVMQLCACTTIGSTADTSEVHVPVIEIEKYGHAVLEITTADLIASGYELGDVVSVSLGAFESSMPFYDGYYSNPGNLLLRGGAPEDYVAVCINYGDFSEVNGVEIGDIAEITMVEKAGMRAIQELYALQYSNNRDDYPDDASFANFRMITSGRIGEGRLFRTASPINNENGRADYADALIEAVGVATVLNLADSDEDIKRYFEDDGCDSAYYRSLYETGSIISIDLTGNFYSEEFATSVAEGLTFLAQNEALYCIHCTEGKDRAGFTAMLLEALMGATLDEIVDDYMLSFYNYYNIDKDNEPERYQAVLDVNLMAMLCHVTDAESVEELEQIDLENAVTTYLINAGMSQEDIIMLKEKL